jgi:hypothetical protein
MKSRSSSKAGSNPADTMLPGACSQYRCDDPYRERVRWFGPPRLRIVVPDSRNML